MFVNTLEPILVSFGPISIRYYGVIYASCFIITYFMLLYFSKKGMISLDSEELSTYLLYLMVGIIAGARLLYVIIYNNYYYYHNPLEIIMLWKGGLSFHGGLLGGIFAGILYARKYKKSVLQLADITVIPLALCLALGRIGNFINGELPGRITTVPWCVYFQDYTGCRHPSQIYASLKNIIIFGIVGFIAFYTHKKNNLKEGTLFSLFLLLYGSFRFIIEFFREADIQIGYYAGFTMGQLLSILCIIGGVIMLYYIHYMPSKTTSSKK